MHDHLKTLLEASFEDRKVDSQEKFTFFQAFMPLSKEMRAFVRNRAFDLAGSVIESENPKPALKWLESVVRILDSSTPEQGSFNAHFSPGPECRAALIALMQRAKRSLDICVFTISDNEISEHIVAASKRGVDVRIISDNDKMYDRGSDIEDLAKQGLSVRIDKTRHHMHHKFMVVDNEVLATGSFNWTRSATEYNHENVLVLEGVDEVVRVFVEEFEQMWQEFSE